MNQPSEDPTSPADAAPAARDPRLDRLFEPVTLGKLALRNRVVMAPMTRQRSPGGVPTEEVVAYYRRRAENGVGLIVSEGVFVPHAATIDDPNVPYFYGEAALGQWGKVLDAAHAAGAKMMPQIWHVGMIARPGQLAVPAVGPSGMGGGVQSPMVREGPPMSQREIDDVVRAFGDSAASAFRLGFDGVELHAAHGYLIDQFFWSETNLRDDAYGMAADQGTRFAAEIVREVRRRTAPDFPIQLRFSQWKLQDYNARHVTSPAALAGFLRPLVDAGVDIFHCSQRRFWEPEFEGSDLNLAGWTKTLTGKPTVTVGSVSLARDMQSSFEGTTAETTGIDRLLAMLDRGDFDLVAVGRAIISDPAWATKVARGDLRDLTAFDPAMLADLV